MPRNPNKTRCTFPGCHNWAMRGEDRCHVHRYAADPALPQQGAPPDEDDPLGLLPPVEGHVDPGDAFWPPDPDLAELDGHIVELNDRLRGLAAHTRRLDAQLEHDPALLPSYIRLLTLQGRLTSRLSRLLRERLQIRQTEDQDLLHQAMNNALDQAGEILGVDL
jgi:hypothetical protein